MKRFLNPIVKRLNGWILRPIGHRRPWGNRIEFSFAAIHPSFVFLLSQETKQTYKTNENLEGEKDRSEERMP